MLRIATAASPAAPGGSSARYVAEQVGDRRSHERNVRKQHQPLVNLWPATITNCGHSKYGKREQGREIEHGNRGCVRRNSLDRVRVGVLIATQIEPSPDHGSRRGEA